jgi:hypothetical protein
LRRKWSRQDARGRLDLDPGRGGLVDVELVRRGKGGDNVLLQSKLVVLGLCRVLTARGVRTIPSQRGNETHAFCLILLSMAERISSKMDLSKR